MNEMKIYKSKTLNIFIFIYKLTTGYLTLIPFCDM